MIALWLRRQLERQSGWLKSLPIGWLDLFRRTDFIAGASVALVATLLGFFFAAGWDVWKESRREVREQQRAARLVLDEIAINTDLLKALRNYLNRDTELSKTGQEVVSPPTRLAVEAWQTTRLAGSFSSRLEFAAELAATYLHLTIINQRLQTRELFRATNQALTDYHLRRALINNDLADGLDYLIARLQKHRKELEDAR
jgi:hypothetical protein